MIDINNIKKSSLFQKINFDNSMISVNVCDITEHPIHFHSVLEIVFVIKGSIVVKSSCTDFNLISGEYMFINGFEYHSIKKNSDEAVIAYLHFSQDESGTVPLLLYDIDNLKKDSKAYHNVKENLINIISAVMDNNRDTNKLNTYVQNTIKDIYTNLQYATYSILGDKNEFGDSELQVNRLNDILDYLYLHYDENITLGSVAATFGLSKYYLAHILKKGYGKSFIELLNMVRVDRSEFYLLDNDMTISQVCGEVGFSSQNYFTRCFKEYFGCTPLQYRKKYKKETLKYKNFVEKEYFPDMLDLNIFGAVKFKNTQENMLKVLLQCEKPLISVTKETGNQIFSERINIGDNDTIELDFDCDALTIVIRRS